MVTIEIREGKQDILLPQHMPMSIYTHAYNEKDIGKAIISVVWEAGKLVSFKLIKKGNY